MAFEPRYPMLALKILNWRRSSMSVVTPPPSPLLKGLSTSMETSLSPSRIPNAAWNHSCTRIVSEAPGRSKSLAPKPCRVMRTRELAADDFWRVWAAARPQSTAVFRVHTYRIDKAVELVYGLYDG